MSSLVVDAIARAGLAEIAFARHAGDLERVRAQAQKLTGADLLALGALADLVRTDEVGDTVRVYTNVTPEDGEDVVDMHAPGRAAGMDAGREKGIEFLRAVAVARITGPRAAWATMSSTSSA